MLALIDYGSGNIRSVENALRHEGADVKRVSSPEALEGMNGIVLPGVGAFGDCADGIRQRGLWEPLQQWLAADRPFLGICVGYQLLFEEGDESPGVKGFGFFGGRVKKFSTPGLKIPQIGWNQLDRTSHLLWTGLPPTAHVYFVHSYFPEPTDPGTIIARSEYGETFAAATAQGRVAGVQFHPEKSQAVGLRILRNFIESVNP
ncbi:MAG TPA: imidazole glycerol phosphate synthase subunit HisH [Chthoniobacteraceae bacterium]|jgi:imidazole glycerol phosphate synthase glutamine amidotransferase subunit|nr:imidazole glycerol phosphate synthase subunit HisH [Chthoniobacteraceae bacterium]